MFGRGCSRVIPSTVRFTKDCGRDAPPQPVYCFFGGFGYLKLAAAFRIMTSLGKGEHATASLKYIQTPQKSSRQVGEGPSRPQSFVKRTVHSLQNAS